VLIKETQVACKINNVPGALFLLREDKRWSINPSLAANPSPLIGAINQLLAAAMHPIAMSPLIMNARLFQFILVQNN